MKKLYHGACFYPELWDDSIIREDIKKMKEVGINVVRIGEFWWSKLEPSKGEIDTSFIRYIIDLLYENGIETILCTPTPTPPIWVTYNKDEVLHVDSKGQKMIHGSRQHVCTNNHEFRIECRNIIEHIAKEVANHPGVILWQLDNELKCHISECFCSTCKSEWHKWLEKKFGTIENLNKKWGTMIWSELYQSFEQVPQPFESTPFIHSPSLSTMYRIYHREKISEFANEHIEIIRKYSSAPITTNTGLGFSLDNELLFENLDCVGYDTYASHKTPHAFTINCDVARGIKKGKNFWLLETSSSHVGALDRHSEVHPNGYLVCEAIATYALGGEGFNYWLWRQQQFGCEINHSAVLSAWGKPGVGYENVLKVEEARKEVEEFMISTEYCQAEVAVTYSDRARAFMMTESHKYDEYRSLMTNLYNNILKTGVHRDLTTEEYSLEGYKMLITPFMYYLSDEYLERAKKFVEDGGIWIVGPLTGGRTENHTVNIDAGLSKKLEDLAGIETLYTYPIGNSDAVGNAFGVSAPLKLWASIFKAIDATVMGTTVGGVTPNCAFITENKVGKGKVVMVGAMPYEESGDIMWQNIINHYSEEVGITLKVNASDGVIAAPRCDDNGLYQVIVNMKDCDGTIELPNEAYNVLDNVKIPSGTMTIKGYEYKILKM